MSDLEKLKAIVARLETSDKPCVEWMLIFFHARRIVKAFAKPK